jgi:hypothetical protein
MSMRVCIRSWLFGLALAAVGCEGTPCGAARHPRSSERSRQTPKCRQASQLSSLAAHAHAGPTCRRIESACALTERRHVPPAISRGTLLVSMPRESMIWSRT